MHHLNHIIADNLKTKREARNLSLDQLAKISGVSKSMLAQIERGEANPSITTVWKIANGLKISFTSLMHQPDAAVQVVSVTDVEPLMEDDGRLKNYPIFPYDEKRPFEVFRMEIAGGGSLISEAHPPQTHEYIVVFSGELQLLLKEKIYTIGPGDAISFSADQAHTYRNMGQEMVQLSMVLQYRGLFGG